MTPIQCKMARVATGLGVRELAARAKVSPATVTRFEGGEGVQTRNLASLQRALEEAGVIFIAENGEGPGVRLRKQAS